MPVYWGDGASFRSWSAQDALNAAAGLPSSGSEVLAQLGSGSSGWGELRAAAPAHGGGMLPGESASRRFWVRNKSHSQLQLELVKDVTQLFAGPEANFISGNVETLHTLLEGDEVSALAVPPAPSAGLPFMGNVTRLFQQVYWSVAGPDMQDHLDLGTGEVSTLVYAAGLDWVVKQWYPKHGLFTNCIWLWPADQAAWFVRSEVQKAKEDGRLPEDFVAQELPPDGEATPPGTLPPPPAPVTSTARHSAQSGQPDVNDTLLAPLRLRRECGAYAWTFQELCRPNDVVGADCASCVHPMLWTYAALAAGLALLVAIVLPYLWCVARRRKRSASVSDLGSGKPDEDGSCLADFVRCRKRRGDRHGTDGPESRGRPDEDGPADCVRRRKTSVSDFSDRRGSEPGMAGAGRLDEDGCLSNCVRCRCRRKVVKEIPMSKVQPEDLPELLQAWEVDTGTPPDTSMSNNSPRPSTDAQSKDDAQSAQSIQQILKGTWQPGLSSSGAAAAAGRLTDAMRKFMNPRAREEDKWRILNDVEDILRTLGSALPAAPRGAAWAWHARQTARLHRSNALLAARQEATSMTEDFREDLSQRIVSGVRHLEIEALAGAGEDTGDNGDMHNSEARESLQRAVRLQMEMEQLKTRMDSLKGGDDLLLAGHLLDCREALRRLADQAAAENQKAENNQGDGNLLWKQLASDLEEVQKDLDAKLSSKVPRGWRGMTRSQTGTSEASRWLSRLKEAASRAALFARAVRSRKDKEQLQKLQEQLLSELQSSEAEAAEGGARGDKWKQLHSLWSRLKGELEQAKQLPSGTSQDAASRLTSFVAARRSKLTSQKRSQTQPLGSLAEDVDKAAAEKIREDLEKLRRKVKQLPGKAGSEQQLLMAGFLQLHGEESWRR
ncbi:unnamed protein product [Effrenium voratum]|nr:unnamed protein product [Effrenium voratum]